MTPVIRFHASPQRVDRAQSLSRTIRVLRISALSGLQVELLALASSASQNDGWWHSRAQLCHHLPAAELLTLVSMIRTELGSRTGAVLIRTGADMPADCMRLLQIILGESFGPIVTIAPDEPGRPLFRISAVEGAGRTGAYAGNGKGRNAIGLHTDGSGVRPPTRILSMCCVRPARRGGETRLADARAVHARLSRAARRVLESPLPRENPYDAAAQSLVAPVFDRSNGLAFSYHPARVRNGIQAVRGRLSAVECDALAELDALLEASAVEFKLEAGDILMLDNVRLAHDRRAFVDDPAAPRLLERLWVGRGQANDS